MVTQTQQQQQQQQQPPPIIDSDPESYGSPIPNSSQSDSNWSNRFKDWRSKRFHKRTPGEEAEYERQRQAYLLREVGITAAESSIRKRKEEESASRAAVIDRGLDQFKKASEVGKGLIPKVASKKELEKYDTPALREWNNPVARQTKPLRDAVSAPTRDLRSYTNTQVTKQAKEALSPSELTAIRSATMPKADMKNLNTQSSRLKAEVRPAAPLRSDLSSVKRATLPRLGKIQSVTQVKSMSNTPIARNTMPSGNLARGINLPKPSMQSGLSQFTGRPMSFRGPTTNRAALPRQQIQFNKPVVGNSQPSRLAQAAKGGVSFRKPTQPNKLMQMSKQVLGIRKPSSSPNYYKKTLRTYRKEVSR